MKSFRPLVGLLSALSSVACGSIAIEDPNGSGGGDGGGATVATSTSTGATTTTVSSATSSSGTGGMGPICASDPWSITHGEAKNQWAGDVAITPDCGAVLAAYGAIDFGIAPIGTGAGTVVKLDAGGHGLWARKVENVGVRLAVSPSGNVILAGQFFDALTIDGVAPIVAPGNNLFVEALDSSGQPLWAVSFPFGEKFTSSGLSGLAIGPGGEIYLTGRLEDSLDFGTGKLVNGAPDGAGFVARLDASGKIAWSKSFGEGALWGGATGTALAVGPSGNVALTGWAKGAGGDVDLGSGPLTLDLPGGTAFIALLDPSGVPIWTRGLEGPGYSEGQRVVIDAADNVLFAGQFTGELNALGTSLGKAKGARDVFVVKLDGAGTAVFARAFGDTSPDEVTAMATDAKGNVLVAGALGGTLLQALDPLGNSLWGRGSDTYHDRPSGLAVDASGNAIVTGTYAWQLDLGAGLESQSGWADFFAIKLPQ